MIDETTVSKGLRRLIEGDVGAELRRKLRKDGVEVEVDPAPSRRGDLTPPPPSIAPVYRRRARGAGRGPMPREKRYGVLLGVGGESGCDRPDQLCHRVSLSWFVVTAQV